MLTSPGHESGVRDSRGRPAVLVLWLMRPSRGIVLKKGLNSGKITATLSRAGQIIQRKSIDQREQTLVTEENPPSSLSLVDPNRRVYTVASAAQIEANRRNAQKSTGPKTERGKARARRNAITHGMTARTIMPVLPQKDPKELEDRTQQAITAMKPRNPLELDLVCRAVRLSGEIDRAERVGTAHPGPPFGGRCQALASADPWPQLFSDVSCVALWISSEGILTRLYSVLHWFHKRLEVNVKKSRENRCFQIVIVFSFGSVNILNTCTVLWRIAARLIAVSTSVNKEKWVKLSRQRGRVRARPDPAGGAVERGAWGERTVSSEPQGSEVVGIEKRQNEAKSIGC